MRIESPTNPLIQTIAALQKKKERDAQGLLLVEGPHPIQEAVSAGLPLKHLFLLEAAPSPVTLNTLPVEPVSLSERVMKKLATTDSAPPCLAVFEQPRYSLSDIYQAKTPLLLILDGLQDPGNLGTLIRSAAAFGATAVLTSPGTTDPYSPKVIRASAGVVFSLPVVQLGGRLEILLPGLKEQGIQLYATTSHSDNTQSFRAVDYQQSCAIILGSEGPGLSPEVLESLATAITIPISDKVESLNVGICGSIILAQAAAQRSPQQEKDEPR